MFVLKIHVLDSRDGAGGGGGGGEGKMKEVLRSSADDGHGHGHGDAARMEAEEAEEEGQEQEQEEQGRKTPVSAFAAASEETTRGITHLFRNVSASAHSSGPLPPERSEHLCILAIPSHMKNAEFYQFMGPYLQNVKEVRFVRNDFASDRYSTLMKFDSQSSADSFYKNYNGKPFSSCQEEACHALFVSDVQFTNSVEEASTAPVGLTELPTCPLCLERLDQHISGIVTPACNNLFYTPSILKWKDTSCPVCHYCQERSTESTCTVCSTSENLWICVICSFVGCGRYQQGHAIKHWKESQHCYSLEVETQRVWDYVGDGYVHRLIQSKTDGKLVELNAPCSEGTHECGSYGCSHDASGMSEALMNSKLDGIFAEYNQLLTSQLEKQREYYEGILSEAKQQKDILDAEAVEKAASLKLQKLQSKLEQAEKEKKILEQLNESMKANQDSWKLAIIKAEESERAAIKERDDRIADLEEQVRDFMVCIEAQRMLTSTGASEIQDGAVLRVAAPPTPKHSSKSSGRKKK